MFHVQLSIPKQIQNKRIKVMTDEMLLGPEQKRFFFLKKELLGFQNKITKVMTDEMLLGPEQEREKNKSIMSEPRFELGTFRKKTKA